MTMCSLHGCRNIPKVCFNNSHEIRALCLRRGSMQLHINNHTEQIGFWAADEQKLSWEDDNTCILIHKKCGEREGIIVHGV